MHDRAKLSRPAFLRGLGGAAALAAAAPSVALAARERGPEIQSIIDRYLQAHAGENRLALVVGVVSPEIARPRIFVGGSPILASDHSRALTLDGSTPFLIGSNTKCFTSRIYAMRQGNYDKRLGDCITVPIGKRLAATPIRDLANYNSGFPEDNQTPIWYKDTIDKSSLANLLRSLAEHPQLPPCDPGTVHSYSNFAFGLLGLAAIGVHTPDQPVTQQAAAAVADLNRHIGLSDTTTPWRPSWDHAIPAGYSHRNTLLAEGQSYGRETWLVMGGGGNLVSCGNDMLRWLEYNMGRTGLDRAVLEEMQTQTVTYDYNLPPTAGIPQACRPERMRKPGKASLGWFHRTIGNREILTKNGGVTGFSSWMAFEAWAGTGRPARLGVVVLANGPKAADVVGRRVLRMLMGEPRRRLR